MDKIILYGAGKIGEQTYTKLAFIEKLDRVYAFCDKNSTSIQEKNGIPVIAYEEAKELGYPFVITLSESSSNYVEVREQLENDGLKYYLNLRDYIQKAKVMDIVEYNRAMCAEFHVTSMDTYFERAEEDNNLNRFWDKDSVFFKMFSKLDLTNVVELACGRGRHVQKYIDMAGDITLVDILEKNIDYTKKRFANNSNVHFIKIMVMIYLNYRIVRTHHCLLTMRWCILS